MNISSSSLYTTSTTYEASLNSKDTEAKQEKEENVEQKKLLNELNQNEKKVVLELQSRDTEVRAHEAAHKSGGASTGAATYTYQKGPDGKMYAIGGEVSVTYKEGSTPHETIANAQAVIASALAPANPSAQDVAVASSAMLMMMKAEQQLANETQEKLIGKDTYKNEADKSQEAKDDDSKDGYNKLDIPA